jgi:tetratricopeptide (TPR) repeat protein
LDEAIPILEGLENPEAQAVLADIFVSLERDEDAILLYDALRAVDPDNSDHWFGLGRSYYRSNKFDEAIPMMEEALQRDPGRVEAWGTLASIYYQRDDWVNAGVMLLNYLMFRPDHAASIFLLATCFDKLGDYERALLHYNQFIELDDGSDDARTFQVQQRARSLERLLEER